MSSLVQHYRRLLLVQGVLWSVAALAFLGLRSQMPPSIQLTRDPATFGSPDVLWLGGVGMLAVPLVAAAVHPPGVRVGRSPWLLVGNAICTVSQAAFWLYAVRQVATGDLALSPWSGRLMAAGSLLGVLLVALAALPPRSSRP